MAINIDTVYQTVQALANKEQRGYITPQEFNLFANQAQHDIFEQYFYDLNAVRTARPQQRQVGDSVTFLQHKLSNTGGVTYSNTAVVAGGTNLPTTGHTGQIFYLGTGINPDRRTIRLMQADEIKNLRSSAWHAANFTEAVYFEDGYQRIQVYNGAGQITTNVTCEHVTGMPRMCNWGYIVVNEEAVYDPITSGDFSLHLSERPDLVVKILKLAGVSIEDQQLYSAASAEDGLNTQQENK